ncbi:MAG: Excinuclease ABC C subunit domain protein [Parcubacteria group bacterium GW2011_GWA1_59_11]|nr:MAG: Excinuclease ABC C subunit domain protein [Parcubacteria group bacterium GW2011_GWA1_59_11]
MYFVYYLHSKVNNDLYIGSCEDVDKRLCQHNAGRVRSTKAYRPWELLGSENFNTRSEAVLRERHLKNHQQKEILKRKFGVL